MVVGRGRAGAPARPAREVRVPWFVLNQGEADVPQARGWWLAGARGPIGPSGARRSPGPPDRATAPLLMVQQTGGYMHNSALNLHQCKLDQLDLVRETGGVLIGPLYPYKIDNSTAKGCIRHGRPGSCL